MQIKDRINRIERGVHEVRFLEWIGDARLFAAFTHGRVALLFFLCFFTSTSIRQVQRVMRRGWDKIFIRRFGAY
jgi:hypothetical protein